MVGIGVVLVFPAIWTKFEDDMKYWNLSGFGHSVGAGMLALAGLGALFLLLGLVGLHTVFDRLVVIPSLAVGGLLLLIPLGDAVSHLGNLKIGGWLGVAACAVIALGSILLLFAPAAAAPAAAPAESAPAAAPAGPRVETAPAGWYPDPSGQAQLRFWSGSDWTDQTR